MKILLFTVLSILPLLARAQAESATLAVPSQTIENGAEELEEPRAYRLTQATQLLNDHSKELGLELEAPLRVAPIVIGAEVVTENPLPSASWNLKETVIRAEYTGFKAGPVAIAPFLGFSRWGLEPNDGNDREVSGLEAGLKTDYKLSEIFNIEGELASDAFPASHASVLKYELGLVASITEKLEFENQFTGFTTMSGGASELYYRPQLGYEFKIASKLSLIPAVAALVGLANTSSKHGMLALLELETTQF